MNYNCKYLITRNEVTFLYVLLECFKWISTYFKANNAINPYNIDSLWTSKDDSSHSLIEFVEIDYHAQVMTCGHCHVCSIRVLKKDFHVIQA